MMRLKHLALGIALILAATTVAEAGKTPEQTGAFVAYCAAQKNWKDCHGTFVADDAATTVVAAISGDHSACTIPSDVEKDNGMHQIVAWLPMHKDYDAMSVHDGVQAAEKVLWNCRQTLAWGMTKWNAPDTVGRYLAFCDVPANHKACMDEIEGVVIDITPPPGGTIALVPGHCPGASHVPFVTIAAREFAWLKANPQPDDTDTLQALATANDALWPCH